jgi:hypothetical protein
MGMGYKQAPPGGVACVSVGQARLAARPERLEATLVDLAVYSGKFTRVHACSPFIVLCCVCLCLHSSPWDASLVHCLQCMQG